MNMSLPRALGVSALALFLVGTLGCAKRIPSPSGAFEATQRVVLTLSENRSISGRIGQGNRVEYAAAGTRYRARVRSLSEESIVLENLILTRRDGSSAEAAQRLRDSRIAITEPEESVTLLRKDIEQVAVLRPDTGRSLRGVGFWGMTAAFIVVLLGERS